MNTTTITVEIDDNKEVYISNDGSSGVKYNVKDREELKKAFEDYIDNMPELESWTETEDEKEMGTEDLVRDFLKKTGKEKISIFCAYRDEISSDDAAKILSADDPDLAFNDFIIERYDGVVSYEEEALMKEVKEHLRRHGIEADDEALIELLWDLTEVDYSDCIDRLKSQTFHTLVMVDTGDGNYDFTCNTGIVHTPGPEYWEKSSLAWLAEQQGRSREEMQKHFTCTLPSGSPLIRSMYQEIWEAPSDIQVLTFLTEMSLEDLMAIAMDKKKELTVKLPKNTMCGLYDPVSGGGSLLEIDLEKDVEIPARYIWSCMPDVVTDYVHYSVESTYGLIGSAYTRSRASITKEQEEKE